MSLLTQNIWNEKIFNGDWCVGAASPHTVVEAATGETLGAVGMADANQALASSTAAAAAQRDWGKAAPSVRAQVLRRAAQLWQERAGEVQEWLIREAGSVRAKAELEVAQTADACWEAAALPTHPTGEMLASNEDRWSMSRRRPAGVVTVIAPFNFPLLLAIRSVAPALALGNAVVLKPDPRTAVSGGVTIARIFEEAGLPEGLLHVLPGDAEVGKAVVTAPEVAVVSFTGSTGAGRHVGAAASGALKRVHLELGGNNALVVLPGADVAKAASAGAFGSWLHQGQICMTTGRHLVHESIAEEYIAALTEKARHLPVGNPYTDEVALGPIIDDKQREHVHRIVTAARDAGDTVHGGGEPAGRFYPPTVISCDKDSPAWREEIFGPVAPVVTFASIEEAAELVNDSEYGLSVGILGEVGMAMELADLVDSGKIHINEQTVSDEPNVPFGGVKDSGNGSRFGGAAADIEAFTEVQWLTMRPQIADYPF
ncbi:benzaldehyde dehydrogenase [Propioniferax innocua]|uniref:Benzaldehyde dehydrogenase (NAD+) n=1 Tax=Propioniferax innocua TaxID=1753 RepID=A0A542ZCB0_9ACTN|nr:benzaldehyde dehydrogenase [Propioniferax innocua]TQL57986.1 benzaldehyde dehydrogenase (NAD+) [Propioniferax innocua]